MCNDGTVEYGRLQCWNGEYNKQPYAYPHALSVLYRVFGVRESIAFAFNAVVMALTVCAVYLLVTLLFRDRTAALCAGLLMVLTPEAILWSATAAVEPSASLACVAALVCAAAFANSRSTIALVATAASTAYAVQFRPESFLIVPVIGFILWQHTGRGELTRLRLWAVGLLALALVGVHLGHLIAVRSEGWGARDARLSLGYLVSNLRVNGWFYLADERFPVLFTVLAAGGVFARRFVAERVAFVLYFLLFFTMYLLFYAGSYNYGADVRYSLMTFPPLAVLGGLGASALVSWLDAKRPGLRSVRVVAAALVFQFLWYAPVVRATTEEAWASRADVAFARSLTADLRGNSYVLTHNPGMFQVWGISAGQMSLVVNNPGQLDFLASRYQGVYLHWNFWCNVPDPVQGRFCLDALRGRPASVVRERRERDQRYSLYRFDIAARPR
jgi:4-amino-4-deoxy-L-arabinose transferase-like glycosyltransferase